MKKILKIILACTLILALCISFAKADSTDVFLNKKFWESLDWKSIENNPYLLKSVDFVEGDQKSPSLVSVTKSFGMDTLVTIDKKPVNNYLQSRFSAMGNPSNQNILNKEQCFGIQKQLERKLGLSIYSDQSIFGKSNGKDAAMYFYIWEWTAGKNKVQFSCQTAGSDKNPRDFSYTITSFPRELGSDLVPRLALRCTQSMRMMSDSIYKDRPELFLRVDEFFNLILNMENKVISDGESVNINKNSISFKSTRGDYVFVYNINRLTGVIDADSISNNGKKIAEISGHCEKFNSEDPKF